MFSNHHQCRTAIVVLQKENERLTKLVEALAKINKAEHYSDLAEHTLDLDTRREKLDIQSNSDTEQQYSELTDAPAEDLLNRNYASTE